MVRPARVFGRRGAAAAAVIGLCGFAAVGLVLSPASSAAQPGAQPNAAALAAGAATAFIAAHPAAVHASSADAFVAHPVISVPQGLQYVPFDRTYKGVPVYGGDFVVTTDSAGQVLSAAVAQSATINLSTAATVSGASAAAAARAQAGNRTVDSVSAPRRVVLALGTPRLTWETVVASHTGALPSRMHVYTDAHTGALAYRYDEVRDGTGTAHYNGPNPVTINTTHSGTTYTMTDPTRTNVTCRQSSNNAIFTGPDDVWGNGSATNLETGCVDALFDLEHEWSMLGSWLGRNGIDGSGGGFPISMGLNDVNAYYDGTQVQVGHNNAGDNIAVLDVVGHEFGHGVDDHTPGGIGSTAVAEFTADTFGAMTEWYTNEPAAYDPPDYTVGEEVNLVGNGPIRYMYNPSLAGDPNCYSSSIPSAETHAAAGPGNHWFYLVAEGTAPTDGQPASPTCNSTSIAGIGIQNAGKIFYNAMLSKTTNMTYVKYRTQTLIAAKNLFPNDCSKFNVVKAAWDAVSVPAQTGDPTCSSSTVVTVNNPGARATAKGTAVSLQLSASGSTAPYTWTATGLPAGLTINSAGLISGTPTTIANYTVTATAKSAANVTGSATFSWAITATSVCSSPGQKLGNPGFETGSATPWTASAGVVDNSTGEAAHGGSWKAWLNGYGTAHTDTLSQSVAIPAGCKATLTFYLHIDTAETSTTVAYDKLTLQAGSTTVATYSNLNKATGYLLRTFDISSLAGTTAAIKFTGVEDSSLQTSFVLDDAALTLS